VSSNLDFNQMSIAILVDNPRRDLDGCVLLAKHLVVLGHKTFLVPMYNQFFDIVTIKPTVVVVNYVRNNNIKLLKLFRFMGIRVAILDTEGAPARMDQWVKVLGSLKINEYVDHYFFWGESQRQLANEKGVTSGLSTSVFGSPRYDYCFSPWKSALPDPGFTKFILVNTAFPYLNPKYTTSPQEEQRAAMRNGVARDTMDTVYSKGLVSFAGYKKSIREIASVINGITFIVRPHPFEHPDAYSDLLDLKNVKVIQKDASVIWINKAISVLHINCTTSIESRILGKIPISLDWLNFEESRVKLPNLVSVNAGSTEEVILRIKEISSGQDYPMDYNTLDAIKAEFGPLNGTSSENTAYVIDKLCNKALPKIAWHEVSIVILASLIIRKALGFSLFQNIKMILFGKHFLYKRNEKLFTSSEVNNLLLRLNEIDGKNIIATQFSTSHRLSTNESILLSEVN
jgi:surface carbohydrate biosynthesis protein